MSASEENSYESDDDVTHDFVEENTYNKEITIVKNENRITSHVLSPYEQTKLISIRIGQLASGSSVMCDITGLTDPAKIAKRELMQRKSPIMLRRHVGDIKTEFGKHYYYEDWDPNTMEFSVIYTD